ncbi:MAG TPA: VOC family protein [Mycobacteriales bacterium]|nr:VOC family protein [Mycobacteriales bacterium]
MLTTNYVPGVPNWVDLTVPDVETAAEFYRALLGWEFQSAGPTAGGYGFFRLGGRIVAALGPFVAEEAGPEWTVYFHVTDADATARAVRRAGGTVRVEPCDVFTAGRTAACTDPTGARFAVWQPGERLGLDAVTVPNTLCWTELYTIDEAVAKDFYRAVFGWSLWDVPMPGVSYAVAAPSGGGQQESHAGIMRLPAENLAAGTTSGWHPYFEVADCDGAVTTAADRGASVLMPPEDFQGVGRLALLTDPFGAMFALITSSPT